MYYIYIYPPAPAVQAGATRLWYSSLPPSGVSPIRPKFRRKTPPPYVLFAGGSQCCPGNLTKFNVQSEPHLGTSILTNYVQLGANLVPKWPQKVSLGEPREASKPNLTKKLQNLILNTIYHTSGMSTTTEIHQFRTLQSPKINETSNLKKQTQ